MLEHKLNYFTLCQVVSPISIRASSIKTTNTFEYGPI